MSLLCKKIIETYSLWVRRTCYPHPNCRYEQLPTRLRLYNPSQKKFQLFTIFESTWLFVANYRQIHRKHNPVHHRNSNCSCKKKKKNFKSHHQREIPMPTKMPRMLRSTKMPRSGARMPTRIETSRSTTTAKVTWSRVPSRPLEKGWWVIAK